MKTIHMRRAACGVILCTLLLTAGCFVNVLVWSPDGNRAIVFDHDDIYLCDKTGQVTPLGITGVSFVAWFPDSQRIACSLVQELNTWDAAAARFPDDAAVASQNMEAVRMELLSPQSVKLEDGDQAEQAAAAKIHITPEQFKMAIMDLRDHEHAQWQSKLNSQRFDAMQNTKVEALDVATATITATGATPGPVIWRQPNADTTPAGAIVSPAGTAVAIQEMPQTTDGPTSLQIVSAGGGGKVIDLEGAIAAAWLPDGKSIAYLRPAAGTEAAEQISLGMLSRMQVLDDQGQLIDSDKLAKPDDLAGMIFSAQTHLQVAKDGRIFFDTLDVHLPTTTADASTKPSIYCYDPQHPLILMRVVPIGLVPSLGDSPEEFSLSPDSRYIAIPFDDGRVSVLDTMTGDAPMVQTIKKSDNNEITMTPVWRTATELTFRVPPNNGLPASFVTYSMTDKSQVVLSKDWNNGPLHDLVTPPAPPTNKTK